MTAKRTHVLGAVVAVALAGAIGLRVRHHLSRPAVVLQPQRRALPERLPPAPRDWVAHPAVEPAERDRGPQRIVSLAPSITEAVCALGLGGRLVGKTPYCNYPPEVEAVPAVGALTDFNLERIRSLRPELVLITANSGALGAALGEAGLTVRAVPHETLADVYAAIEQIGAACDRPATARRLAEAIRAEVELLARWSAARVRTPRRVLVVLGDLPVPPRGVWAAGPGSFLDEMLEKTGHVNAAREALRASHGEIPLARLVALDPEVILEFRPEVTDAQRLALYRSWAEVGRLRAIEAQRVRCVGGPEWLSAGPRIAIGLHRLIRTLGEFESGPPAEPVGLR